MYERHAREQATSSSDGNPAYRYVLRSTRNNREKRTLTRSFGAVLLTEQLHHPVDDNGLHGVVDQRRLHPPCQFAVGSLNARCQRTGPWSEPAHSPRGSTWNASSETTTPSSTPAFRLAKPNVEPGTKPNRP